MTIEALASMSEDEFIGVITRVGVVIQTAFNSSAVIDIATAGDPVSFVTDLATSSKSVISRPRTSRRARQREPRRR
jgi:hypothetical protein